MYLNNAQALLGDAFDYAINACGIAGGSFMKLFSVSSVSNRIENGEAAYIMGKSGIEAAVDVLVETTGKAPTAKPKANFTRSREYWIGWAVAYYQWFSGRKFSDIFKVLSFEDLERMYAPLHEADISKFTDIVDAKVREYFADTNLKRIRTLYSMKQKMSPRSFVVPWGTFLPIRLQTRALGYNHKPSVTKSRVRLQPPGRHRAVYP